MLFKVVVFFLFLALVAICLFKDFKILYMYIAQGQT